MEKRTAYPARPGTHRSTVWTYGGSTPLVVVHCGFGLASMFAELFGYCPGASASLRTAIQHPERHNVLLDQHSPPSCAHAPTRPPSYPVAAP